MYKTRQKMRNYSDSLAIIVNNTQEIKADILNFINHYKVISTQINIQCMIVYNYAEIPNKMSDKSLK